MNKERLINTFLDLVKIYSPTNGEEDLARDVCRRLKNLGLNPKIDEYFNVTASVAGKNYLEPIILNAHLDSVEPCKDIKPIIKDNVIYSSGDTVLGADNKIAVASILEATTQMFEEKFTKNRPIDLVFTVHEESSTDGPRLLDYNLIRARKGYSFDVSQPIGTITMASPFYNRFDIKINGRSAHTSRPDLADNALKIASAAINNIELGRIDEDSVRNIIITEGGHVRNAIPGAVVLKGEVRSYNQELVEKYCDEVEIKFQEAIRNLGSEHVNFSFEKVRENGGFKYAEDDSFILETEATLKQLGFSPVHDYGFACFDANVFAEMGVQIINLADGGNNAHSVTENVSIKNLEDITRLVYSLAINQIRR